DHLKTVSKTLERRENDKEDEQQQAKGYHAHQNAGHGHQPPGGRIMWRFHVPQQLGQFGFDLSSLEGVAFRPLQSHMTHGRERIHFQSGLLPGSVLRLMQQSRFEDRRRSAGLETAAGLMGSILSTRSSTLNLHSSICHPYLAR